ncbi:MAG: hypothetical protein LBS12_06830 [Prevotellaceae bacterium]|nr:hypothetical protein [Prevotellaceae bacterium]
MKEIDTGITDTRKHTGAACGRGGSGSIFLAGKGQPTPKYRQKGLFDPNIGSAGRQKALLGRKVGSADRQKVYLGRKIGSADRQKVLLGRKAGSADRQKVLSCQNSIKYSILCQNGINIHL